MSAQLTPNDYCNWDWLPQAAREMERVLERLLAEPSIKAHVINARPKSIESFLRKCTEKDYADPMAEVTDAVAARIITYSVTDRDRVAQLVRDRFLVKPQEDRNPGEGRPAERRGYDCIHLVVTGERVTEGEGWLTRQGSLAAYFGRFGGLEIQVRTVAAHAWAEFEHARRYKGSAYGAIGDHDQQTVDQLFGAAADARKALDEIFEAIDRVLANPSQAAGATLGVEVTLSGEGQLLAAPVDSVSPPLDSASLGEFLKQRYPDDQQSPEAGLDFAIELIRACGITSVAGLQIQLADVDSDQVRALMSTDIPVTTVRRLDDELLALGGEDYIRRTGSLGKSSSRMQQLQWRYDRVRGKSSTFELRGADVSEEVRGGRLPAARAVRELARIVANKRGAEQAEIPERISQTDTLPAGTRSRDLKLDDGSTLWVSTNLNRSASRDLIAQLLARSKDLDVHVFDTGQEIEPRN